VNKEKREKERLWNIVTKWKSGISISFRFKKIIHGRNIPKHPKYSPIPNSLLILQIWRLAVFYFIRLRFLHFSLRHSTITSKFILNAERERRKRERKRNVPSLKKSISTEIARDSILRIFLLDNANCNLPSRASQLRSPLHINFPGDTSCREHAIVVFLSLRAWPRRTRESIRAFHDSARFRRAMFTTDWLSVWLSVTTKVVLRIRETVRW